MPPAKGCLQVHSVPRGSNPVPFGRASQSSSQRLSTLTRSSHMHTRNTRNTSNQSLGCGVLIHLHPPVCPWPSPPPRQSSPVGGGRGPTQAPGLCSGAGNRPCLSPRIANSDTDLHGCTGCWRRSRALTCTPL